MVSAVIACTLQLCCAKQRSHCCAQEQPCSRLMLYPGCVQSCCNCEGRGGGLSPLRAHLHLASPWPGVPTTVIILSCCLFYSLSSSSVLLSSHSVTPQS
jgi:hypothetical protein